MFLPQEKILMKNKIKKTFNETQIIFSLKIEEKK